MDYVVKGGETIYDVCINANGSLYALDENLDLNGLDSYTPTLYAGQRLTVSDIVRNNAATEVMEEHPLNSVSIPDADLNALFDEISSALAPNFITAEGSYFQTQDNQILTVSDDEFLRRYTHEY